MKTKEARFTRALDRLWTIVQNYHNEGGTWKEFNISFRRVVESIEFFKEDVPEIWKYLNFLLREAKERGFF